MILIIFYSFLLFCGIIISQSLDFSSIKPAVSTLTTLCLSYIMLEVGLEFTLQKSKLKEYGWDFLIASTAAIFPWILCAIYFLFVFNLNWLEAFLLGLFAAPTSAGVLFAMLSAAGLGTTWLFKKARILAIFDDVVTILLIVPFQIILVGFKPQLAAVLLIMTFLLFTAYRWLHQWALPVGKLWLFFYSALVVFLLTLLHKTTHIHLEVLLPAFALGCMIRDRNHSSYEEAHLEPRAGWELGFDRLIKGSFMFLVGCSLPKVDLGSLSYSMIAVHVIVLTVLSNFGKCFSAFCYRNEASQKARLALSIAMFPRGEVGAGVLLIALGYGFGGIASSLAVLSLALNLLLTGVFIAVVIKLIKNNGDEELSNS